MALFRRSKQRGRSGKSRALNRELLIRLSVWGAVFALVLLLMFLMGLGLEKLFYSRNPHFTLHAVKIEAAKGHVDTALVRRRLGLLPGKDNIYELDPATLREQLLQDPIIQEATVTRVLPDRLELTVYGRTPVAQLLRRGGLMVDAEGYVMGPGQREEMLSLPIIVGVPDLAHARKGGRLQQKSLRAALHFLHYKATLQHGSWLDVELIQCMPQHGELLVWLRGNRKCYLVPGAQLVLPTKNLETALQRTLKILEVRSLARQPTGQITATYERIPVTAYRP